METSASPASDDTHESHGLHERHTSILLTKFTRFNRIDYAFGTRLKILESIKSIWRIISWPCSGGGENWLIADGLQALTYRTRIIEYWRCIGTCWLSPLCLISSVRQISQMERLNQDKHSLLRCSTVLAFTCAKQAKHASKPTKSSLELVWISCIP